MLLFVIGCCILTFLMIFVFRRTVVNGDSMNPTLHDGDNLITLCTWNPLIQISNGNIVCIQWEEMIVKRVIASPGDTVQILDNVVYRNGKPLDEPYINEPMNTEDLPLLQLGEDQYFVMGDNRNHSLDSRQLGVFTRDEIFSVTTVEQQPLLWCLMGLSIIGIALMSVCEFESDKRRLRSDSPVDS